MSLHHTHAHAHTPTPTNLVASIQVCIIFPAIALSPLIYFPMLPTHVHIHVWCIVQVIRVSTKFVFTCFIRLRHLHCFALVWFELSQLSCPSSSVGRTSCMRHRFKSHLSTAFSRKSCHRSCVVLCCFTLHLSLFLSVWVLMYSNARSGNLGSRPHMLLY